MEYVYRLAGLQIACSLPFNIDIQAESKEFLFPGRAEGNIRFTAQAVDTLPAPSGVQVSCRYYDGDTTWYCVGRGYPPYAMTRHGAQEIRCYYLRDQEHRLRRSLHMCDLLGLERIFPLNQTMLLHCAFIRINGKALLFSGPSGIGKSTQANLWQRHTDAELCNGDRAALRLTDGQWWAHGLPYAGSSHVFRNVRAPCRGIVMLGQAPENRLWHLSPREAFASLYPQLTLHHWEKDTVECVSTLLVKLISQIPVYRLDCMPDESAVRLLHQEVFP